MNDDDSNDIARTRRRVASGTKPIKRKRLFGPKAPYAVGYARPPVEFRFKPGQSGNPSGRPKGAKNNPSKQIEKIKHLFSKFTRQQIAIRDGEKIVKMPKMDYLLRAAIDKAVKGDAGMTKLILNLGLAFEREEKRLHDRFVEEAIGHKKEWSEELMLRRMKGIHNLPDPIPHPDDVLIDRYSNVSIVGPMTPEEKKEDDEIEAQRTVWKAELAELHARRVALEATLKDRRFNPHRARKELIKVCKEISLWEELVAASSREARYGSK